MERMGHSTTAVTLDNYGHLFPKLDEALDDALDGVYRISSVGAGTDLDRRAPVRGARRSIRRSEALRCLSRWTAGSHRSAASRPADGDGRM